MTVSRLRDMLLAIRSSGSASLGIFMTMGYPSGADTLEILKAASDGGADFLELGLPFSDPLAEGGTIQRSSERALASGVRTADAFRIASAFRSSRPTPMALMGYVNPIMSYGVSNFFRDAQSSGVDAVILPDLPPEEADAIRKEALSREVDLVFLIAPTTPDERIRHIDRLSGGFVYAVSVTGLTGSSLERTEALHGYLGRARSLVTVNPLLVGFGISTREDVVDLTRHTDGCIVGSAFIRRLEEFWDQRQMSQSEKLQAVRAYVSELKFGKGADAIEPSTEHDHG